MNTPFENLSWPTQQLAQVSKQKYAMDCVFMSHVSMCIQPNVLFELYDRILFIF